VGDFLCVQREFGVVKVDGGDGRVWLIALSYLGSLRVVDEDGQTSKDDRLDFEEILGVNPD
jgi:hypothetical protein